MGTKDSKMISEDMPSLIRNIAIPASTGMFFNTMYNVVDNFYAGLISTQAVAALSLSFMLFFLITSTGYSFTSAVSAILGNLLGRKRPRLARIYAQKSLVFISLIALFTTVVGFIIAPYMLRFLGAEGSYLDDGLEYINTILFGSVFFSLNFCLNAILVSVGNTKAYRNSLILGFFLNLVLNPLFIYGFLFIPPMGIAGIALSTVLIQVINMFYMLNICLKHKLINFSKLYEYNIDFRVYKEFLKQGLPSFFNMSSMSVGSLIITYFISSYGYKSVAGYGIGFRIEQLFLLIVLGISPAVLSIISNNFGAKRYDRVLECIKKSIKYAFIISSIGIVFLFAIGKFLMSLFTDDIEVINIAYYYVLIESFVFFAYAVIFICVSTLQGIKKPSIIMYVGVYRQIVAPLLLFYLVTKYFELSLPYLFFAILIITYSAAIFIGWHTYKRLKGIVV